MVKATELVRRSLNDTNMLVAVADLNGRIIGTGTMYLLHKFLYGGSIMAQIEDVAVTKSYQQRGVGKAVIEYLLARAQMANCYKTMLYCDSNILSFYRRLGFKHMVNGMRFNHVQVLEYDGSELW